MNFLKNIINFYIDGFKNMKLGKKLWAIILIKIFIMVFILKMIFFNTTVNTKFKTEEEKINFIHKNLTKD
ncbi:DUF4492 domain-containing protein [Campylobacter blaseri]|uniref:DUF4492 domain-containing protein n=1 Tax=Campylobacter blaseri TaxID=2042961 RepID=A0A2P8R3F5_9BACT|nr:DUF4492 domain-containing protein [Campylobacter blaseri]PSM53027.1 DUF4492 domain-containing protein [Campylobacter blaseri]PSM54494.1 DUF4492 domain-containing protein [Campylobacter blaseri]QKF85258.1 DUF4492 domain-containing protein [Campylobacter blaseri]